MKSVNINGLNSTQQARIQQPEAVRTKGGEMSTPALAHNFPDQVSVSNRAEEAGRFIALAGELGDVRQERVDSLQQAIQSDQYEVSSGTIADAIIRNEGA